MKTNGNLMEQLTAPENLMLAWRSVRGNIPKYRRARSAGPDGVTLTEFERDLTTQLNILQDALLSERYQPQPPKIFPLPKSRGGQREIAVLTVSDRVAQRATLQVLEPYWEPTFQDCSFGFRPGLSVEDALNCAQKLRAQGREWVLDGDISACFDSLDHDLLVGQLRRRVHDRRVIRLIQRWLDVGIMQAGPPVEDQSFADRVQSASRWVQRGADWILERAVEETTPRYGYPRYERPYYLEDYVDGDMSREDMLNPSQGQAVSSIQRSAMQRIAANGLILGAGLARSALTSVGGRAITFFKSPLGRRAIKKVGLASGGLAGVAVTAAAVSYLFHRKAGPAPTGVLQGSPLSPLLANIYMHLFDLMMTKREHALVRFADDWVVLAPTRRMAESAYKDAERSLKRLRLELNSEKTHIRHPEEKVNWLGGVIL